MKLKFRPDFHFIQTKTLKSFWCYNIFIYEDGLANPEFLHLKTTNLLDVSESCNFGLCLVSKLENKQQKNCLRWCWTKLFDEMMLNKIVWDDAEQKKMFYILIQSGLLVTLIEVVNFRYVLIIILPYRLKRLQCRLYMIHLRTYNAP